MKRFLWILILFVCNLYSLGQIAFDDDFENGKLDSAYLNNGEYLLSPVSNLHCRVINIKGQTPMFKIYDTVGYQLRQYHYMVYRYEGDSIWYYFDNASKSISDNYYHFKNEDSFTSDTIYIAYWFPYTYTDLQRYIDNISNNFYLLNCGIRGHSYEGRNIWGYEITDSSISESNKQNIVITVRQHPSECISGYLLEGLSDYLLFQDDSISDFIRKNYHFFIYPMLNPDGVVNGSAQNSLGQGLNREWGEGILPAGTPEIDTIRPVIWNDTKQKVNWAIDIHSNAGSNLPYYWWGYTGDSDVSEMEQRLASEYVLSVFKYDQFSYGDDCIFQNYIQGNGVGNSNTAANWFRRTFGAISYTLELTSEPFGSLKDNRIEIERIKQAGISLIKGFYNIDLISSHTESGFSEEEIIFPNPAIDIIHVNNSVIKSSSYVIFDIVGRKVTAGNVTSGSVDVSSLRPGEYILRLQTVNYITSRKLVIVK